jgi:hypothetical protein
MAKSIKYILTFVVFFLFFSCSQADSLYNEYVIEIERTDTTNSINDSTNNGRTKKDTLFLSYEKYMSLSPTISSAQGAACYDKYFVQCYAGNSAIEIYDLEKKAYLCKIKNPYPGKRTHANTVCFGNQRYAPDDFFPLLYINSGYTSTVSGTRYSFVYVYRLVKSSDSSGAEAFNLEFLNTISFKGFNTWTEGILDNDHQRLWVKYEPNGNYNYAVFEMPKFENGDVTINYEDAIVDFSLGVQPFTSSNQGHLYYNDNILLVSGTSPKTQKLAFMVINTLTHTRDITIDLSEIGLNAEPENVFFYKDQLMIGYRGSIYKFNLYKPNK